MNRFVRSFLAVVGCIALVSCGGGSDDDNVPDVGGDEFSGSPSKLFVHNDKRSDAKVYVTFGADSCITQANFRLDGETGKCTAAPYAECVRTLPLRV